MSVCMFVYLILLQSEINLSSKKKTSGISIARSVNTDEGTIIKALRYQPYSFNSTLNLAKFFFNQTNYFSDTISILSVTILNHCFAKHWCLKLVSKANYPGRYRYPSICATPLSIIRDATFVMDERSRSYVSLNVKYK